jgi:hypothetical protein
MKVEVENSDAAPIPGVFHTAYWVATIIRISGYKANTRIPSGRVADPHNFYADPNPAFHFHTDPSPAFTLMRIRILLLIRVMRICDHWSAASIVSVRPTALQGSILSH